MSCLVYGGSFAGLKFVQTRIITTGNTGRRIIMPIKQKYTRRFRKSIISTMVLMVTGAWKSIWNAEATLTVQLPFINIWIQSWDSIPLSAQRSLNMSTENRIKYSTINLIRISQQMKSTGNGVRTLHICSFRIMRYATTCLLYTSPSPRD